jgi:hypothetical protein
VDTWTLIVCSGCVVGGTAGLYALHRLALWLEERGHLYYLNKKPKGSGIGSFVALQRAIEPQVQHVIHITDESRLHGEQGGSGQGSPDAPDASQIEPNASHGESDKIPRQTQTGGLD